MYVYPNCYINWLPKFCGQLVLCIWVLIFFAVVDYELPENQRIETIPKILEQITQIIDQLTPFSKMLDSVGTQVNSTFNNADKAKKGI